jgi:hypothetical protein
MHGVLGDEPVHETALPQVPHVPLITQDVQALAEPRPELLWCVMCVVCARAVGVVCSVCGGVCVCVCGE